MSLAQLSVMEGKEFWSKVEIPEFLSWLSSDFLGDLWGLGINVYEMGAARSLFFILCYGSV